MTTDFETFVRESLSKMDERFDKMDERFDKTATKADLADLATKADLADLATKADLADLATKADLARVEKRLTTAIRGLGKAFMDSTGRVRDDEFVDA